MSIINKLKLFSKTLRKQAPNSNSHTHKSQKPNKMTTSTGPNPDRPTKKQKTHDPTLIEPKNTLYINNLNDQIRLHTLRESLYLLFATYGEVLKVSVRPKTRGQAFITFRTVEEANLALLSLKDETFFSKPLRIQFSNTNTTKL